jgi:hypothetical protein
MIPQTFLDSESGIFLIRTSSLELDVLLFRCITLGVDLCPKGLAFYPKSTGSLGLRSKLALCFGQVVQKQKADAKVLMLPRSIRTLVIGRQAKKMYKMTYLVMRLGFEPDVALVNQSPKLRRGCTLLHNASNVGLVLARFWGEIVIRTK